MASSYYSSQTSADPGIYSGYEDILGSLARNRPGSILRKVIDDGPSSFWIVGERKMGKTSMLLYLEDVLANNIHGKSGSLQFLPLYVSCRNIEASDSPIGQLLAFYQQIIQRIEERWCKPPFNLSTKSCLLMGKEPKSVYGDQLLRQLVQDLAEVWRLLNSEKVRVVLLIDDVETGFGERWSTVLFAHLKRLLTDDSLFEEEVTSFSRQNIVLFLASNPLKLNTEAERLQRAIVEKPIELKGLDFAAVNKLVRKGDLFHLNMDWVEKIYRASGGHPWLVQYIMEQFCSRFIDRDEEKFARNFDGILKEDFQKNEEHQEILRYWFDHLPEAGTQLIVFLLLHDYEYPAEGLSVSELADEMNLPEPNIESLIQPLWALGIIYEVPLGAKKAFHVSDIFKFWFLKQTGGDVWQQNLVPPLEMGVAVVEQLRNKPFYLHMSLKLDLLVADGLYTHFSLLPSDFNETANTLARHAQEAATGGEIKIRDAARFLQLLFVEKTGWQEVWERYLEIVKGESSFICKIEQRSDIREGLLDFPIEFLKIGNNYLALEVPMFKQVVGLEKERTYELQKNCFQREDPVNFLLVASNVTEAPNMRLASLPDADEEMNDICKILLSEEMAKAFKIGQIVVLINNEEHLEDVVQNNVIIKVASSANFEQALAGNLEDIHFDVVHYSGHYIIDKRETRTGFVFRDSQVFSLAKLRGSLRNNKPDFLFLNSCRSGAHEDSRSGQYLGAALTSLNAGVLAVVGMRWPINDSDGRDISKEFYYSLVQCGRPEKALFHARRKVHENGDVSWAAPVMLTR